MVATGKVAVLRVGHQMAVRIRDWCLTASHETLGGATITLVGKVDSFDSYWSTQQPAKLGVDMGDAWWVWREAQFIPPSSVGSHIEVRVEGNPQVKVNFLS